MTTTRRRFLSSSALATLSPVALSFASKAVAESGPAMLPPAIAALKNRRSEAIPIASNEREERIARARELMDEKRLTAICIAGGTTLDYFTGVKWGNSERLMMLVLPVKGEPFGTA